MRNLGTLFVAFLVSCGAPFVTPESPAADSPSNTAEANPARQGDAWTRTLKDRAQRGTLHDALQVVRGDSGKWNDEPIAQHAPPLAQKPPKMSLDDWADQVREREFQLTSGDDNWLLFRTRQLDDNDRVWVDRVERQGNRFTIVVNEAIWQGRYSKTFTYYSALGVNLGKLAPGKYEATWIVKPLEFKQFEGDGRPTDNWPKEERPAEKKPAEWSVKFSVADK